MLNVNFLIDILVNMIIKFNYFIIFYVGAANIIFILLLIISFFALLSYLREVNTVYGTDLVYSNEPMPISILVPAYDEGETIVDSVRSLISLGYPQTEIIVINDGSKDDTMINLIDAFHLIEVSPVIRKQIETMPVKGVYYSTVMDNLVVVDKENGGKADALNCGINVSRYPLFAAIDADSVLEADSLIRVVRPFIEDPERVVACGGIVRVANGCVINKGNLESVTLPKKPIAIFQVIEYLRAFLSGRVGWSAIGGLLIVSGAFGIFKKSAVLEVGGYRVGTVGEDMDLILKLHEHGIKNNKGYRIIFIPDPVCWTQVPEDIKSLRNQRIRWHVGLMDCLINHRRMIFNPHYGAAGMFALPYQVLFEFLGPAIEIIGYIFVVASFLFNILSSEYLILFLAISIGFGILLSLGAILSEEYAYRRYKSVGDFLKMVLFGILENFGYRQLNSWWKLQGILLYRRRKNQWGKVARKGFSEEKGDD